MELLGRSFASRKSLLKYKILDVFELVYTKSPLKSFPYGIIEVNEFKKGIISTLYMTFKPNNDYISMYLRWYFNKKDRVNNFLQKITSKGAKNTLIVSDESFLKNDLRCPDNWEEMLKIYKILNSLKLASSLLQCKPKTC
ncbi:hypothetical protein [Mycoplasma sp. HS2188]|uniref:hypothetical protein n=1 Tax=Mycoplasma sp. HS2188 TaxID=2976765 RepID=UPI0021A9AC93|nr:hypothetical protein [Mycoplasma sp. HS2188]MCT4469351.1 hypothetical protein [Mycoplasma sp. HS2188]